MRYKKIQPENYSVRPFNASKEISLSYSDKNEKFYILDAKYSSGSYIDTSNGSYDVQNRIIDSEGHCLNYTYPLIDGSSSINLSTEPMNEDGSYKRLVFDSISTLLYGSSLQYITENIIVFDIQRKYFGEKLEKGSINITDVYNSSNTSSINISDDTFGNLIDNTNTITGSIGTVFYEKGLIVITDPTHYNIISSSLLTNTESSHIDLSYKSSMTVYENEIDIMVDKNEFNISLNPTFISASLVNENTDFSPYVSEIGIYDDFDNLLCVAKLSKPVKKNTNIDSIFVLKFDT